MKKHTLLKVTILAFGLFIIPHSGFGKMRIMSDQELKEVTGMAGIAIQNNQFNTMILSEPRLATSIQNSFKNLNGIDFYFLLYVPHEHIFKAATRLSNSTGFTVTNPRFIVGKGVAAVHIPIEEIEIHIESMKNELVAGNKSMGTIGVKAMNIRMSGDIYSFTRN